MIYAFTRKAAVGVGVNAAIVLNHIGYWLSANESNGQNFKDGRYWMYYTIEAFCVQMPFFSRATIVRILNKLKAEEYIVTGEYNESPYDHTKWYSLTDKSRILLDLPPAIDSKQAIRHAQDEHVRNDLDEPIDVLRMSKSTINKKITTKITNKITSNLPPALTKALDAFAAMRKKIRAPLTDRAIELTLQNLERIAPGDPDKQAAILDQSTMHGWRGVFPLKNDMKPGGHDLAGGQKSASDMAEESMELLRKGGYL